jgi:stage II sporulation protein D
MPTRLVARAIGLAVMAFAIGVGFSHHTPVHGQTIDRPPGAIDAVRIGVLGLFHPREFRVEPIAGQGLILHVGNESVTLEQSSGVGAATIHLSGARLAVNSGGRELRASAIAVTGRMNEPADFALRIPGKMTRRYHGTLEIEPWAGSLLAILTVDRETAVASVVAAESSPDTPLEALKAQAVAARSYFVAGRGRHHNFDFCDTTHCQFLRNPPAPDSDVAVAVKATRGLVLVYNDRPIPAMYTRSCSGRTHTPRELGMRAVPYPYYAVACDYCRSHPANWTSRLSARDASWLRSSDELARLKVVRQLGWSVVPSNDFVATKDGEQIVLHGVGNGHGIGLCQAGAKGMAELGARFGEILNHYYPNTSIVSVERAAVEAQ